MSEKQLPCSVVQDLLPSYIEDLTQDETSAFIENHLLQCAACRQIEQDMRAAISIDKAPQPTLIFLKRIKRRHLLAAVLAVLIAVWCICWLYNEEFHYANSESGRLAAVEDFVPSNTQASIIAADIDENDPLRVIAYQERDGQLYIAYAAANDYNTHGVLYLVRGLNGNYRTMSCSHSAFPYTAGVMAERIGDAYAFIGAGCREIYQVRIEFLLMSTGDFLQLQSYSKTYDITEADFLWLMDQDTLAEDLGIPRDSVASLSIGEIHLLDKDGQDVTELYCDASVNYSGGVGKSKAETFLLYVYMGIVAVLGIIFVRYFLQKN